MTSTNDGDGDGEVELFEPELVLQSTVPDPPVRLQGWGGQVQAVDASVLCDFLDRPSAMCNCGLSGAGRVWCSEGTGRHTPTIK